MPLYYHIYMNFGVSRKKPVGFLSRVKEGRIKVARVKVDNLDKVSLNLRKGRERLRIVIRTK